MQFYKYLYIYLYVYICCYIPVRKQLESALESCLEEVNKYKNDADIARNKVREAVEMVEKLCSEKDQLMEDLNNSKGMYFRFNYYFYISTNNIPHVYNLEQISRLENKLKNLIQETEKKVRLEVENVKTTYKNKLREANVEIEALRSVCLRTIFVIISNLNI